MRCIGWYKLRWARLLVMEQCFDEQTRAKSGVAVRGILIVSLLEPATGTPSKTSQAKTLESGDRASPSPRDQNRSGAEERLCLVAFTVQHALVELDGLHRHEINPCCTLRVVAAMLP